MKFDRNRGFWLVYWMQKFEKNIGLQNRRFSDVLFIFLFFIYLFIMLRLRKLHSHMIIREKKLKGTRYNIQEV